MNVLIPILLTVLGFSFLLISLLLEIFNDGNETYDNASIVTLMLSIIMFFVGAATFLNVTALVVTAEEIIEVHLDSYIPVAWLNVGLAFIPIVFLVIKTFDLLGDEEY
jgi:hypothetical protein